MRGPIVPRDRPKSPNIQVYRPQLTSVLSIANRISGVVTSLVAIGLVLWLLAVAAGPQAYVAVQDVLASPLGQIEAAPLSQWHAEQDTDPPRGGAGAAGEPPRARADRDHPPGPPPAPLGIAITPSAAGVARDFFRIQGAPGTPASSC